MKVSALREKAAAMPGHLAAAAGHTVRLFRGVPRGAPGFIGAGLVSYGTGMIYLPAGVIAAGLFFLLLDRRL